MSEEAALLSVGSLGRSTSAVRYTPKAAATDSGGTAEKVGAPSPVWWGPMKWMDEVLRQAGCGTASTVATFCAEVVSYYVTT